VSLVWQANRLCSPYWTGTDKDFTIFGLLKFLLNVKYICALGDVWPLLVARPIFAAFLDTKMVIRVDILIQKLTIFIIPTQVS